MELYRRPATQFVAGFIGSPAMNLFPCRLVRDGTAARLEGEGLAVSLDAPPPLDASRDLVLGVRPPDVELVGPHEGDAAGRLEVIERLGHQALLHVALPHRTDEPVRILGPAGLDRAEGAEVELRFRRDRLHLFDRESGRRVW
jgi:sn-glycerol 3-phosphate transport system ATP-binding protein